MAVSLTSLTCGLGMWHRAFLAMHLFPTPISIPIPIPIPIPSSQLYDKFRSLPGRSHGFYYIAAHFHLPSPPPTRTRVHMRSCDVPHGCSLGCVCASYRSAHLMCMCMCAFVMCECLCLWPVVCDRQLAMHQAAAACDLQHVNMHVHGTRLFPTTI